MQLAAILDSTDEVRQLAALQEVNSALCHQHSHSSFKLGEVIPVLVKVFNSSSNPEMVLLACRGLNTAIDINPRACDLIIPAVSTLCEKLLSIEDIDVAEQCMKCLSLLATEHSRLVFEAGGLTASTTYFDFFPQHIQHMALSTCVHLSEGVGKREDVRRLLEVVPFMTKCLGMEDDVGTRRACEWFCRVIENFSRAFKPAPFGRPSQAPEASGAVKSVKTGIEAEGGGDGLSKMNFFHQLASSGLVPLWLKILAEGSPRWNPSSQAQILSCLATLLEVCPALLPRFFENEGVQLLKRLLMDYVDPLKNAEAGGTASPAYISAILRLASGILPSADAVLMDGVTKKKAAERLVSVKKERPIAAAGTGKESTHVAVTPTVPPAPQPAFDSASSTASSWSCGACTFLNKSTAMLVCEVCQTLNPTRSPALSATKTGREVSDAAAAPGMVDFDLESTGPTTVLEVYAQQPEYYELYAQDLLIPLFRLALQTSVPGVSKLVFTILASLRRHHVETLSNAAMASNVSAIIFQYLISADLKDMAQAVDFGASLLTLVPEYYKESMLRHGIFKEVTRLHRVHTDICHSSSRQQNPHKHKRPSSKGRAGSSSSSYRDLVGSPSVSSDSTRIVTATSKFLSAMRSADGASSKGPGEEQVASKRKRQSDNETASTPSSTEIESAVLKRLRSLAQQLREFSRGENPSKVAAGSSRVAEKRQRDGRGRAVTCVDTTDYAVLLEPLQALASLLTSAEGVTVFEMTESGMIDALMAFLFNVVKTATSSATGKSGRSRDCTVDLYAFASAFSQSSGESADTMDVDGSSSRPAICALVDVLQAALNAMDALPSTRHGGEGLSNRYRALIRPFKFRVRDKSQARSGSSSSSSAATLAASSTQYGCSFVAEPLTTVGHLRQFIETQIRAMWRRRAQEEAARAAAPPRPPVAAKDHGAQAGGSNGGTSSSGKAFPPPLPSSLSRRTGAKLQVDTALDAGSKRVMLRRSPRVEAQATKDGSPFVPTASKAPTRSYAPPTPSHTGGSSVASRTRSHNPSEAESTSGSGSESAAASDGARPRVSQAPDQIVDKRTSLRSSSREPSGVLSSLGFSVVGAASKDTQSTMSKTSVAQESTAKMEMPRSSTRKSVAGLAIKAHPDEQQQKGKGPIRSGGAALEPPTKESATSYGLRSKKTEGLESAVGLGSTVYSAFNVRGRRVWYSGKVTAVSVDDKLDVRFEDGEQRYSMSRSALPVTPPEDAVLYKDVRRELQRKPRQLATGQQQKQLPPPKGSSRAPSSEAIKAVGSGAGSKRGLSHGGAGSGLLIEERKRRMMLDEHSDEEDMLAMCGITSAASSNVAGSGSNAASGGGRNTTGLEMLNMLRGGVGADTKDVQDQMEALRSLVEGNLPPAVQPPRSGSGGSSAGARGPIAARREGERDFRHPSLFQRSMGLGMPTAILRRRFREMEPMEEPAGLIMAQLHAGYGAGVSTGLMETSMIEEGMRLDDDGYSLHRRKRNVEGVMKGLIRSASNTNKPSVSAAPLAVRASTTASGTSSSRQSPQITISDIRLCIGEVSVVLESLPSGLTTLEAIQGLLWARNKGLEDLKSAPAGAYRGVSVDDREWPEAIVEFQVQEVSTTSTGESSGQARKMAAQDGEKEDVATTESKAPAERMSKEPLILSLGSSSLGAAMRRGCDEGSLMTLGTDQGGERSMWRETNIESQGLRDTLRLLRVLLLISRDMERSSRTLNGTPAEQEFQSKIEAVDWGKVAAACMVKSLSRKFAAQFQDPVGIASETWPDWCDVVAREFTELLPFDVRIKYFQGTAFSRSRVIHQVQEIARRLQASNRESSGSSNAQNFLPSGMRSGAGNLSIVDYTNRFGSLRRRKMVLPRNNLLAAAVEAFKKAAESGGGVEVGYGEEHDEEERIEGSGAMDGEEDEDDDKMNTQEERQQPAGGSARAQPARGRRGAAMRHQEQNGDAASDYESMDDEQVHEDDDEDDYAGDGFRERAQGSFREAILAVDFEGETGHGNGPTQEFYSLICREIMRTGLGIWRGDTYEEEEQQSMMDDGNRGFVHTGSGGLFPSVTQPSVPKGKSSASGDSSKGSHGNQKRSSQDIFRFLGRFIGKALQDDRLLDLPLSPVLCKILVGHPLTLHDVASVDPSLGRSLLEMQRMAAGATSPQSRSRQLREYVESLHLDFTLPGAHWYELKPNGSDELLTPDRVNEYLELVTKHLLVESVKDSLDALRAGIEDVFPVSALRCFAPHELQQLLCGGHEEDWRVETIGRSLVCKHGYTRSSPQIQHLVRIMASFDAEQRKQFLMFITGTPRLPIGGFSALSPNLTVVRKDVSVGAPDDYLPSCSTCQVYLKLPAYSGDAVMRRKLQQAMTLGQEHFALD